MSGEITTIFFYILCFLTVTLQAIMWYTRSRFLKAISERGLPGSKLADLETMLRIVIPIKLNKVNDQGTEQLRRSAVKASNYWLISLLLTLILPPILFGLTN